ncbi:MAG: hypothetical protein KBD27_02845 [Candidatus Moranbacteria bacterium]|nr:hypothetical protein [Candidatus Moranbacteria bacterium]
MFFPSPITISEPWKRHYQRARLFLYVGVVILTIVFTLRVLFPTITQGFDFRNPGSSKNGLSNPRLDATTPRTNGKIEANGTLIANTAVMGDFSRVAVTATLEKKSAVPETLDFTLRRSYQSFLYPTGTPVTRFPEETTYRAGDTLYALREGILYPFVSEQAYLSRYREDSGEANPDILSRYPISDIWLGFRVGSLLSNATGVFIVVSETEVRPVGSAEIFLALGYNFDDVIPVSEEELGVYKRGRIFLLGIPHPDGTLLLDQDTETYFLIDAGSKRPLSAGAYRDFLLERTHPILVSTKASEVTVTCTLLPNIWSTKLSCTTPIDRLVPGFGNDFELRVTNTTTAIDLNALSLAFETAKNKQNMMTLLSQIKQRLLSRFLP